MAVTKSVICKTFVYWFLLLVRQCRVFFDTHSFIIDAVGIYVIFDIDIVGDYCCSLIFISFDVCDIAIMLCNMILLLLFVFITYFFQSFLRLTSVFLLIFSVQFYRFFHQITKKSALQIKNIFTSTE